MSKVNNIKIEVLNYNQLQRRTRHNVVNPVSLPSNKCSLFSPDSFA